MSDIINIGVNDHNIDLFESQFPVKNGMSYNSYLLLDEKIAVFDTVEKSFGTEWLNNLKNALNGKEPDYLIIQHMEPDHSANIDEFFKIYKNAALVCNAKTIAMVEKYFKRLTINKKILVQDGEQLNLGNHNLTFVFAPMVHWPEVMVTYDSFSKTLFSADAFGKFGALDVEDNWIDEARRYYFGIVGKFGAQVNALLNKASSLDIQNIYPLHGPVLTENINHYLNIYSNWASYNPEENGILIAYTSIYGNTKSAVLYLENELKEQGFKNIATFDLSRCDIYSALAVAFKYNKIILASTTYNGDIFPKMSEFLNLLTNRNFKNRKVAIIENSSWAPSVARVIKAKLSASENIEFLEPVVSIKSSLGEENLIQIKELINNLK